jgi:hypothetical protein
MMSALKQIIDPVRIQFLRMGEKGKQDLASQVLADTKKNTKQWAKVIDEIETLLKKMQDKEAKQMAMRILALGEEGIEKTFETILTKGFMPQGSLDTQARQLSLVLRHRLGEDKRIPKAEDLPPHQKPIPAQGKESMDTLKKVLSDINERIPESVRTAERTAGIVAQLKQNAPKRWVSVKKEIDALLNAIPKTDTNKRLLSVLAEKGARLHENILRAMIAKNFNPETPNPSDALAKMLSKAFSADLSRAYAAEEKTTQGKKATRSEGAKLIDRVESGVLELQGESRPLLSAWLASQGIPALDFAAPVEWEQRRFVLDSWADGVGPSSALIQKASQALKEAKLSTATTQSMNIEGEEGGEILQVADPRTIAKRDGKTLDAMSVEDFEEAVDALRAPSKRKEKRSVAATLWSAFWDAMSEPAVEVFVRSPSLLPSDAWLALAARSAVKMDEEGLSFGKEPLDTSQLSSLLGKIQDKIKEGVSSEKNKDKLIQDLPATVIDVVAADGFSSPNAPTGGYTWKDVLAQLNQSEIPILPMARKDQFHARLHTADARKAPDDRGILFDLGTMTKRQDNPRKPSSKTAPKSKGSKARKGKRPPDTNALAEALADIFEGDDITDEQLEHLLSILEVSSV